MHFANVAIVCTDDIFLMRCMWCNRAISLCSKVPCKKMKKKVPCASTAP